MTTGQFFPSSRSCRSWALLIFQPRRRRGGARNARWIALWTTLITFVVSLILVWRFDPAQPDFQFVEKRAWLGGAINYRWASTAFRCCS